MPNRASQINSVSVGTGPPAILIHGNPATHTLWRPLAERLAGVRTLHMVDLPGFGASPAPASRAGYTLKALAASIVDVADARGIDTFDLVGHSFGGGVAITIAALVPERVRSLIAITPLPERAPPLAGLLDIPMVERTATAFWRHAPHGFRRWFARNWTHLSYGAGHTRARAAEVAIEADRDSTVESMCRLMLQVDYEEYRNTIETLAASLKQPLLLIGAGRDRIVPLQHFQEIRRRLPAAACHIFPDGGHVPMWQYPDEVARLVEGVWG